MIDIWEDLKNFKHDEEDLIPIAISGMEGKHHTDEAKKAIGDANRGRVISEEGRKKMSLAHLGKSNPKSGASRLGKPFSEEHKRNKSIAAKKWWAKRKEAMA